MASLEWLPQRTPRLRNVAYAVGLAAGCTIVLLLCAGRGAPASSAYTGSDAAVRRPAAWTETGDISPTWTSTVPVAIIVDDDPLVWSIAEHDVTITFYKSSVVGAAWFTFTPASPSPLPGGYQRTPYFFDLESEYLDSHKPVSLGQNGIEIELVYDESHLGEIGPGTLQFFHYGATEWVKQGGEVDPFAGTLTIKTKRTESWGVGGYGPRKYIYLPIVNRK